MSGLICLRPDCQTPRPSSINGQQLAEEVSESDGVAEWWCPGCGRLNKVILTSAVLTSFPVDEPGEE